MIAGADNGGRRVVDLPHLDMVVAPPVFTTVWTGLTALTMLNEFIFPAMVER